MNIGEIIRTRRQELGLTLENIGDYVGVGKSTVRKWEHGDIENMKQSINEYMGKDFSYLDSVEIINQGIIDRKCDANEFDKE